jgi:tetratricopeptide (TPR) repeat protein
MKFILLYFLGVLLLFPILAMGQEKKFKVSKKGEMDDIFILTQKAEKVSDSDPKQALDYIELALTKSLDDGNKAGEARSYFVLGLINYKQRLYSQSSDFYLKALNLYQSLQDKNSTIDTRKKLGKSLEANGNVDQALDQYNQAVSEATQLKNEDQLVDLKSHIGELYENQGKFAEALKYYNEVLKLEQQRKNRTGIINANNKIGNVYLKQSKTDKAKEFYEKSQEIATEQKDQKKIAESFSNMSNTFRKDQNVKEELKTRKRAIEINTTLNDSTALAEDYVEVGKLYLKQNANTAAVEYLEKGEKLSKETGDLEKQAEAILALSEVYKDKKDYVTALNYYNDYVKVKDSILIVKENTLASLVNYNDQISLKQKKIDLLESEMHLMEEEKHSSELLIYFLTAGIILVLISSWIIYNNSRKRRIANQVLALKSLRSQMNPHFIFNALNSVNNYISKNDERSANKYLSDFSKLMRTVMENSQLEFINLSTELQILQLYLTLEHSRFKEKFDYELIVTPDINQDFIEIPPMLIQPYIENAIWHGLRYREEKGMLKVVFQKHVDNGLEVIIEDNGIGRKKSMELKTINQKDKISTGLKNTESRLKIINELYRTRMQVEIEDLDKIEMTGTKVTILINQAKKQVA